MKIISPTECREWCLSNSIKVGENNIPIVKAGTEDFRIPIDAGKRIGLASDHFQLFQDVQEYLVWFTDWSVWSSGERFHIFDRFRLSYNETRPLIDSPGHLFCQGEFEDALSFVTIGILFLWDLFVLAPTGQKILFFSHDEFGYKSINRMEG
jgi:hypothetical protein